MAENEYIIELENVSKSYQLAGERQLQILHEVNGNFPRHAWSLLLGASHRATTPTV